jgi:hypothetical protein
LLILLIRFADFMKREPRNAGVKAKQRIQSGLRTTKRVVKHRKGKTRDIARADEVKERRRKERKSYVAKLSYSRKNKQILKAQMKQMQNQVSDLINSPREITDEQMLDLFEQYSVKRLMDSTRTWSIEGYRCFRDLVCDSGCTLSRVGSTFSNLWKSITGRAWAHTGRKEPSRKVARTAVCALAAADEHHQKAKDSTRCHQVLADESAHQLMVALVHWDEELDSPEITSAGLFLAHGVMRHELCVFQVSNVCGNRMQPSSATTSSTAQPMPRSLMASVTTAMECLAHLVERW